MNPRVTIFRNKDGNWVAMTPFIYQEIGKCTINEAYEKAISAGVIGKGDKVYVKEANLTKIYP